MVKSRKVEGEYKPVSVPLGEGMVNFDEYFKLIKEYNISWPISIHLEYPPFERLEQELTLNEKKESFTAAIIKDVNFARNYLLNI